MPEQIRHRKKVLVLSPLAGIVLFITLYIIASLLYPGGSQADKHSTGFSWVDNYWCNLLNGTAINGQPNPAQPVAVAGMIVLSITLTMFWWIFSAYSGVRKSIQRIVSFFGTAAMVTAFLLLTGYDHDMSINLSGCCGLIAIIGVLTGLYQKKGYGMFACGLINILLIGVNNYVYYTEGLIVYLPVVQKITFLFCLAWIGWVDVWLYLAVKKQSRIV